MYSEYDGMVHEAYEEILGLEKEAAPVRRHTDRIPVSVMRKTPRNKMGETAKEILQQRVDNRSTPASAISTRNNRSTPASVISTRNNRKAAASAALKKKIGIGAGATAGALTLAAGLYGLAKHRKNKRNTDESVEKQAFAYYEASQMAKEAAQEDYAEACAYEDAALDVLDELGYLD